MKRIASTAIALFCSVAINAVAQDAPKAHTETTTKQTGPGATVKTKAETVTGTVKEYEAGKKIKISGPGDKSYSFDLDGSARLDGTIVVGQTAKVTYFKGTDGTERVTVLSRATGNAQTAEAAPKMHSETTVKHTGPGADTKTTKETVVGTVKAYEPGKSIKIVGPKNKSYSFNLDETASLTGPVSVGDRVKVTYSKSNGGQKVTTVEPYGKS
jgi:hypothetical protein